jgi:myo-inositol-1(or 4)-monophosphatase
VERFLELAISIAKEAGALLLQRPKQLSVDTKTSDIDIVTQMDKLSEKFIVDSILANRPDDGIIGEEGANRPSKSGYTWVIDPIDGTVNYFYNMQGWSVSIAIRDAKGVVVGVVYAPTLNSLFTATRGGGAFLNGEAIKANNPVELNKALIATGFHYRNELREIQLRQFTELILKVRDIRRNGSAAIDICNVAAGMVDGYYEMGLHPWDRDAAELIATEAGALVSVHGELTIAAGPHLHGILSAELL